jgi:hypothetical protein
MEHFLGVLTFPFDKELAPSLSRTQYGIDTGEIREGFCPYTYLMYFFTSFYVIPAKAGIHFVWSTF